MIKPVKSTFAFFPLFSWPNKTFTFCLFFAWKVFSTKVGWVFSSDEKGNEKVFFESDGTTEEGTEHKMDAHKKFTDDRLRERWVLKREITGKEVRMKRNEYKENWVKNIEKDEVESDLKWKALIQFHLDELVEELRSSGDFKIKKNFYFVIYFPFSTKIKLVVFSSSVPYTYSWLLFISFFRNYNF